MNIHFSVVKDNKPVSHSENNFPLNLTSSIPLIYQSLYIETVFTNLIHFSWRISYSTLQPSAHNLNASYAYGKMTIFHYRNIKH